MQFAKPVHRSIWNSTVNNQINAGELSGLESPIHGTAPTNHLGSVRCDNLH